MKSMFASYGRFVTPGGSRNVRTDKYGSCLVIRLRSGVYVSAF